MIESSRNMVSIKVNKSQSICLDFTFNIKETTIKELILNSGVSVDLNDKPTLKFLNKTIDMFLLENYFVCLNSKTLTKIYVSNMRNIVELLEGLGLLKRAKELSQSGVDKLSYIDSRLTDINGQLKSIYNRCLLKVDTKEIEEAVENFASLNQVLMKLPSNGKKDETEILMKIVSKQLSCARRGIEFSLSFQDVKKLMSKTTCHYSGVKLTAYGEHKLTLDRKDANKGYTPDNVVACSSSVNSVKNKMMESCEYFSGVGAFTMEEKKKMLQSFINEM